MSRLQRRGRYARTNADLLVNSPRGFPSQQQPVNVWWWGSDSLWSIPLGADVALGAVNRATSLIVNTIASAPWRLLSGSTDPRLGIIELPPRRWQIDPMLYRPDSRFGNPNTVAAARLPRGTFYAQWIRSALWRGMGYIVFEESSNGEPQPGTMKVLNPDYVAPVSTPYLHRRIGPDNGSDSVETDQEGRFALGGRVYRLIELNNPIAEVDEYGCSPGVLELGARELQLAHQGVTYAGGQLRAGVPNGYLTAKSPTFNKEQADQLREQWMAHHGGDRRSIAVLNSSVEFTPISMSPVDMALVEQRKMSLVDISNIFGVPVYLLGGGEPQGQTYSNAESRSLDFKTYTLLPWANAVEDVLSALLPQNQWISVDFRGLLKADTKTRYEAYELALTNGFLTLSEVRNLENLPPLEESVTPELTAANQGNALQQPETQAEGGL